MSMNIKRDDRNDIKTEKRKQFFFSSRPRLHKYKIELTKWKIFSLIEENNDVVQKHKCFNVLSSSMYFFSSVKIQHPTLITTMK